MCGGLGRGLDRAVVSLVGPAAAMVLPALWAEKHPRADFPREMPSVDPRRGVFVARWHQPAAGRHHGRRGGAAQVLRGGSFGAVRTLRIIVTARTENTTPSDTATGILKTSISSILAPMNTSTTARP